MTIRSEKWLIFTIGLFVGMVLGIMGSWAVSVGDPPPTLTSLQASNFSAPSSRDSAVTLAQRTVRLGPGESVGVTGQACNLSVNQSGAQALTVSCAAAGTPTGVPATATAAPTSTTLPGTNTATAAPTATRTATPAAATATNTPTPTTAPTSTAAPTTPPGVTPTSVPETMIPIVTPTPGADPVANTLCPQAVHDSYQAIAPDGQSYPTWHPQRHPIASGGSCFFSHEHGDDPLTSVANQEMPWFGYFDNPKRSEVHFGHKVHVVNAGFVNDEGSTAFDSCRVVFHMGTGGPGRFSVQNHSIQVDCVGDYSRVGGLAGPIHTGGLADTGGVANICVNPRANPGKVVMTTETGCTQQDQSSYEIWAVLHTYTDAVGRFWRVNFSPARFDPGTKMTPGAPSTLNLTGDVGCDSEFYMGPFFSDATDFGPATGGLGYWATIFGGDGAPQTQFKYRRNYCAVGLSYQN